MTRSCTRAFFRWRNTCLPSARTCDGSTRGRDLGSGRSFKVDEFVVAGITCLPHHEGPFLGRMEGATGQLPIHEVHFLTLVAVGFDAHVLAAARDSLDF